MPAHFGIVSARPTAPWRIVSSTCASSSVYLMEEAIRIGEDLIFNAVPDENILAMLKDNMLKSRTDNKKAQRSCFSALQRYCLYGPEFIRKTTLTNDQLMALTSEELLAKVRNVVSKGHEVRYYGPLSEADAKTALLDSHKIGENLEFLPQTHPLIKTVDQNNVVLAQYDAKQLYYMQFSSRDEKFNAAEKSRIDLYNEYFGGGMNTIVFQEMREARGLAYSAAALYQQPSDLDHTECFLDFIQTQNDKLVDALGAFDEIINDMPVSQNAFDIAKESIISNLRTQRTVKASVLWSYLNARKLGLDYDINRSIYEGAQKFTLKDVADFQQKNIKGRNYTICILGRESDIDIKALEQFGTIRRVTTEEIFGY